MSIVFGWYSFKIKSYTPQELYLEPDDWKDASFEVRQKVFHLFWLPFFSIGREYAVRKQGKLFELRDDIVFKMKSKGKVRTPWYSFLLPILALAIPIGVGIFIFIAKAIMKYNTATDKKEAYEQSIAVVENKLQNSSTGAYLRILNTTRKYDDELLYLKVIDITNNNYSLVIKEVHYPKYEREKYYFSNYSKDTLRLSKQQLLGAICKDYELVHDRTSVGVNFFGDKKYVITAVDYFDEAVITGDINWYFWDVSRQTNFYYHTQYRPNGTELVLKFQNFGIPTDLIAIKNMENSITWTDSLPMRFDTYNYLQQNEIKGLVDKHDKEFKFKSVFTFKDSLQRKSDYVVEGNERFYTVTKK